VLHLLQFNTAGLIILAISFGAAFGVGAVVGFNDEGRLMVIAGGIAALLDFSYRLMSHDGHWLHPRKGGMLLFLPVWPFGMLWVGLGTYYIMTK
jgi:hypothetical protein